MDRTTFISRNQTFMPLPEEMPRTTGLRMPSVVHTANLSGIGASDPALTADALVQRLPSIVNPTPVTVAPDCNTLDQWVSDNPILAAAGLAVIAYLTWRGGKA